MKRNKQTTIAIVLILALVLSLSAVSYAVAESYAVSYSDAPGTLNNTTINTSGFTGTTLRKRYSLSDQAYLYSTAAKPYLTWQSQWKDINTGYRYNGFSSWGSVSQGYDYESYRYPYNEKIEPFLLKILNSDTSSTTITGEWHP